MNGALIEQGIVNIEIDPETALKKFGTRDKSRKKKKVSTQNSPDDLSARMQCLPKLETDSNVQKDKLKDTRLVTNLVQWTHKQRNLLIKIATEHGLTIENPNEKREHQSTEDYILSKSENLKGEVYAMAEKLVIGLGEVESDKSGLIDWENNLEGREETLAQNQKQLETDKQEHAENVQKDKEAHELRDRVSRRKEREARAGLENLEEEKQKHENARSHVSERIHKVLKFLRKKKKEFEAKEKLADQNLKESLEIAKKAETLRIPPHHPTTLLQTT